MLYKRDYILSNVYLLRSLFKIYACIWSKSIRYVFGLLTKGQKSKMASMKTKLIRSYMKQLLKLRKDKQNGALQYLKVNKLRKDVGVSI